MYYFKLIIHADKSPFKKREKYPDRLKPTTIINLWLLYLSTCSPLFRNGNLPHRCSHCKYYSNSSYSVILHNYEFVHNHEKLQQQEEEEGGGEGQRMRRTPLAKSQKEL